MALAAPQKPQVEDASRKPLIPEEFIDVPSQRRYILSIGLLCQAIKAYDWLEGLVYSEPRSYRTLKWLAVDALYCVALKNLRIPRLNYAPAVVLLQIIVLWFVDGLLFGSVQIGVQTYSLSSTARDIYRRELSNGGGFLGWRDALEGDDHLKGEHTVRMSPISTARLNPGTQTYCLSAPSNTVLIPILLNNTNPSAIRYSLTHLGTNKVEYVDFGAKDLRAIEQAREEALQLTRRESTVDEDDEDDYDPDDVIDETLTKRISNGSNVALEKTQSIAHIRVLKPGTVRLQRVYDSSSQTDARISLSEVIIAPCPYASFVDDVVEKGDNIRCVGSGEELAVKVFGVPPLSLKWHREISKGRREHFSVERIEGTHEMHGQPQELRIPLDMPFDIPGQHSYILDSLADGLGNVRALSQQLPQGKSSHSSNTDGSHASFTKDNSRFVTVLRRAMMSFSDCGPGSPATLLFGSETQLRATANDADALDAPWDVLVNYKPTSIASAGNSKSVKPWKKTFTTQPGKSLLTIDVNAPGEYTLTSVKGKYCAGEILSPDTCRVVQQPLPTAEINWKRIHECSGDTGVSAFLVLHGRPPFQIFYHQRRNNEVAKELVHTFQGSRGEIILQPESSGNYTYTFTHLSDANYKRVKLDGPVISQVVHPLASANIVFHSAQGVGNKRTIGSCSGSHVDIDVDLRGNGPWNLEVQIVGPKGTEIKRISDLKKPREKIRLPIPQDVDDEGGTFQIDLVSIEDAHGCKKDLAVPGLTVSVRRVEPSVRFYTKEGKREVIVHEHGEARLPLRLTGEGPWRVKYRLTDPPGPSSTVVMYSPNEHLVVQQKGIYKLLEVADAQCPGTVVADESDFHVHWIDRPSATLVKSTEVVHVPSNNSFIRPPICQGRDDFVELELNGRPPFQISYNVARNNEHGGTKILEQPVISSVQNRVRFQLRTHESGRIYYEVKRVGDANYPLARYRDLVIPRNERLLFEQEVLARPTAYFKQNTQLTHCLRDMFTPQNSYGTDDVVFLVGRPPFHLQLAIKNLAEGETHQQTVEIHEHQWRIDLPNYVFTSIGPHLVSIVSVRDSSSCEEAPADPSTRIISVNVAESAAIVPFDRREHYCVGDVTQFQLEGTPPWTIGYKVKGKLQEQVVKQSPFTLLQQHPGEFAITSIAHQHKKCKTVVENIHFQVHALPSAQVAHGSEYHENIHEGSQAQIVFTLIGEPPFTFTYQRAEPPSRKGGKPGKVLETHTVSGVMGHEYYIYSALEGTWTVTFISDKHCRYKSRSFQTQ